MGGGVDVPPGGCPRSPPLCNSRVNQTDGVRVSAQEAVPPPIFVEGNLTRATGGSSLALHPQKPTPAREAQERRRPFLPLPSGRGLLAAELLIAPPHTL